MDYINRLLEERNRANQAAREIVDRALSENRSLTGEEREAIARADADFDAKQDMIDELRKIEAREADIAQALADAAEVRKAPAVVEKRESDADILRSLATGDRRSYTFEKRALNTSDDSQIVPQDFYGRIMEQLLYVGPMLDGQYVTRIDTAGGNDIRVPTESTRVVGTAVAEGATFAASEGTFSELTLRAHKYGTLIVVSRELLSEEGVDLVGFLGRSLGVALGTAVNSALTLGTGTVQPKGISAAAGSGITGGTGVSGVPTFDNLIDLMSAVDTAYAARPTAAWMMSRATLGKVRKLQDTAGAYLWSPASSVGQPDRILGFSVLENPYVAATATAAKSVLFGDMSQFMVRVAGGIEIARSDEAYFTSDSVAWRATIKVDSDLAQSGGVKYFAGGTA